MSLNSSCLAPTTGTGPETFARAIQYFTAMQCLLSEEQIPVDSVEGKVTILSLIPFIGGED